MIVATEVLPTQDPGQSDASFHKEYRDVYRFNRLYQRLYQNGRKFKERGALKAYFDAQ